MRIKLDSNVLPVIVVILIVLFLFINTNCAGTQIKPVEKIPVTFINENPGVTQLGLVKFIIDKNGEKVDYKLMNLRWDYKLYVVDLEPGVYGVTQWAPEIDKVVAYQTITVGKFPMIVKFQRIF